MKSLNFNEMKTKLILNGFIVAKQKKITGNTIIGFNTGDENTFFPVYTMSSEFVYCCKNFRPVYDLVLKLTNNEVHSDEIYNF